MSGDTFMKVYSLILAAMVAGIASITRADIVPVIIQLNESSNAYSVPADKVLLIEHGYVGDSSGTASIVLILTNSTLTTGIRIGQAWFRTITSFSPSLKIPGGNELSVLNFFNIDGEGEPDPEIDNYVILFGLLVDPVDLYAGIPNLIDKIQVANQIAELNVKVDSPRPRSIQVETSPDLESWTRVPDLTMVQPFSRLLQGVAFASDADEEFMRTRVRSRR